MKITPDYFTEMFLEVGSQSVVNFTEMGLRMLPAALNVICVDIDDFPSFSVPVQLLETLSVVDTKVSIS